MSDSTALALRGTVPELVAIYRDAVRDVRRGFEIANAAEARLQAAFKMGNHVGIHLRGRHNRVIDLDANAAIEGLKRDAWHALTERLELRRVLSVARAKELAERLEKGELPEITEETVADFAQFYLDHMVDMLAESVAEVFEWLRPRNELYKTNSQLEVPPKVVLRWMVERDFREIGRAHV